MMAANAGKRLIVAVSGGEHAGRKAVAEPGQVLRVGKAEQAEMVVPGDSLLSELHFELAWDGMKCQLRDLRSGAGTLLGGQPVEAGEVSHGEWIRAGSTDFWVYFEATTAPPPSHAPKSPEQRERETRVLETLSRLTEPLFAVLDAARNERILVLLRESVEEYRSLYEGPQGEAMAEMAPYLVYLPRGSRLLAFLVREGWGQSWGLFLTSQRPFKEVRRQLRKFLLVKDSANRELYFRFYDPRVLRVFLPSSWPEQSREFFEGMGAYWLEGAEGKSLLRFTLIEQQVIPEMMPLETSPS